MFDKSLPGIKPFASRRWSILIGALLLGLVAQGCGKEEPPPRPTITIHQAAKTGNLEQLKAHCYWGCDVNVRDENSVTPLHWAAREGQTVAAEMLLTKGAEVSPRDKNGETPLCWATYGKQAGLAELLKKHGASDSEIKRRDPAPPAEQADKPFKADFESGGATGWQLAKGWEVVAEDGGNHVLRGRGHNFASCRSGPWGDCTLRLRVKLVRGAVHLNFREGGPGHQRYFIGFNEEGVYLCKSTYPPQEHLNLTNTPAAHTPGRWYAVEISGYGKRIEVRIDGVSRINYLDPVPHLRGGISFETLDESEALIDDVEVIPRSADLVDPKP